MIMTSATMHSARRRAMWKIAALGAFLLVAIAVGSVVPLPDQDQVTRFADSVGWLGAVAFVVGYGLVTLTPVPKNVVGIAAGFVWGWGLGSLLVYLGALIGAALAFLIGRSLGREAVERFTGARVKRVDDLLRRRGILSVIGARLIPVLPFTVINYIASLTAVSRRDYAVGTAVGIIPGTLAYVAIGAFGVDPGPGLSIALGVLGVLTIAGVVVGFRSRRKSAADAAAGPPEARGSAPAGSGNASPDDS
ncbi:MAG: hypothetical protein RI885_844 [Actinomycetota bacterium]|jgi:uncharacterized membrane protein YdjX (TVP38/TMEM64 family)